MERLWGQYGTAKKHKNKPHNFKIRDSMQVFNATM